MIIKKYCGAGAGVLGCFVLFELFLSFGIYIMPAHAETKVSGWISADTTWSKDNSPYLLTDDVHVSDGISLTIDSGVVIGVAPEASLDGSDYAPELFLSGGNLYSNGSSNDRVIFHGVSVFISSGVSHNGFANIQRTDFLNGSGLSLDNSIGTISTSTIVGAYQGLYVKDSIVHVNGSQINNNDIGVYVQPHQVFLLGFSGGLINPRHHNTGGIGNALDDAPDLSASSSLVIYGSSIVGNNSYAITNKSNITVQADGNWWGSNSGPKIMEPNSIQGNVLYSPWLGSEPVFDSNSDIACCSSVLFIPGLEASRLYRTENSFARNLFGKSTTTNMLWEPNRNADVEKLFLNPAGSSTDSSIYSGDPIDKALGIFGVYGKFMNSLNSLVSSDIINEWKAFGYDWRKSIDSVVSGSEKKATTTENLIDVVEDLALRSKTGKVSIVAHSNGGLVAKYLVMVLSNMGKSDLIDSVVSVAVPYLGTPEAVAGLLHGDDQAVVGGLILSQKTARNLGADMPSAYSLLPSRQFFSNLFVPAIAFASTTVPDVNNGSYSQNILSFDGMKSFINDVFNSRTIPKFSNTKLPIKGNTSLLVSADILHSLLDPFVWPENISRWAVVGWNAITTNGILYSNNKHSLTKDIYGDGTVEARSASYTSGQVLPINLSEVSRLEKTDITHANILEASSTERVVNSILSSATSNNKKVLSEVSIIPAVTVGNMDWDSLASADYAMTKSLRISTHSPVKLHLYDSFGNHTGEVPLPKEVASQVEDGLYIMKEEKIPGSTYEVVGCETDVDCDTEITVPDNGGGYTAVVDGVGKGSFTLDIERIRGASTTEMLEWKDVPVTSSTVATTTFTSSSVNNESSVGYVSLASTTAELSIDENVENAHIFGVGMFKWRNGGLKNTQRKLQWTKLIERAILLFKAKDRRLSDTSIRERH